MSLRRFNTVYYVFFVVGLSLYYMYIQVFYLVAN